MLLIKSSSAIQQNTELNKALSSFISTNKSVITLPMLMNVFGYPDPFDRFDHNTWKMLFDAYQRCSAEARQCYSNRIYTWLLGANSLSENAMQARLFLMSQSNFDFRYVVNSGVFIHPILASEDYWAWFALLSRPSFDVTPYNGEVNRYRMLNAIKNLWSFITLSDISVEERKALFNNIFSLGMDEKILPFISEDLEKFIAVCNLLKIITPEIRFCLAEKSIEVLSNNNVDEMSEEDTLSMAKLFSTLVIIPGILDEFIAYKDLPRLTKKLNTALSFSDSNLLINIFSHLWAGKTGASRVCSDEAIVWFLNLKIFKTAAFKLYEGYDIYKLALQHNDYFLSKEILSLIGADLAELAFQEIVDEAEHSDHKILSEPTVIADVKTVEGRIWYGNTSKTTQELNESLSALEISKNHNNMGERILCSLNYPESFHVFSKKTWLLLAVVYNCCSDESRQAVNSYIYAWLLAGKSSGNNNVLFAKIFLYEKDLKFFILSRINLPADPGLEFVSFKDDLRKASELSEIATPFIGKSVDFLKAEFQNQIDIYRKSSLDVEKKTMKIDFLEYVLRDFIQTSSVRHGEALHAYTSRRFFMRTAYELITRCSLLKVEDDVKVVDMWLQNTILLGSGTASLVLALPENYFNEIFAGTSVTRDALEQQVKPVTSGLLSKMGFSGSRKKGIDTHNTKRQPSLG